MLKRLYYHIICTSISKKPKNANFNEIFFTVRRAGRRSLLFSLFVQPPRLLTSRLLKVLHYWVHQTLNRFSTPNYTEKTLTPVPNSREGRNVIRVTSRHIVKAGEGVEVGHGLDDHGFGRGRRRRLGRVVQVWPLNTLSKVI